MVWTLPIHSLVWDARLKNMANSTPVVYDLPQDILTTLARKDDLEDGPNEGIASSIAEESTAESRTETAVGAKACSLCGVAFPTVEEQRSHIRSDMHGYNLKQRIRGAKPVSEVEFEKLVGGEDLFSFLFS